MKRHSPEEELLALKLAYHGIGKYIEHEEESAKCKGCVEGFDKQKEKIAAKIMRSAKEKGKRLQKKAKNTGKIKRRVVLALEKNRSLHKDIGTRLCSQPKEEITEEDVGWLIRLAKEEGII